MGINMLAKLTCKIEQNNNFSNPFCVYDEVIIDCSEKEMKFSPPREVYIDATRPIFTDPFVGFTKITFNYDGKELNFHTSKEAIEDLVACGFATFKDLLDLVVDVINKELTPNSLINEDKNVVRKMIKALKIKGLNVK
jgi:hypothetical protein